VINSSNINKVAIFNFVAAAETLDFCFSCNKALDTSSEKKSHITSNKLLKKKNLGKQNDCKKTLPKQVIKASTFLHCHCRTIF